MVSFLGFLAVVIRVSGYWFWFSFDVLCVCCVINFFLVLGFQTRFCRE